MVEHNNNSLSSMGSAKRSAPNKEAGFAPGPGAYNPAEKTVSNKSATPGWGMGTSKRGPLSYANAAPGPGSYQQPSKIGEGPKYALRPKTAVTVKHEVPGPGQYEPGKDPSKARPPTATMGKESRGQGFTTESKVVPGPGAYAPVPGNKPGPAYSFGTATTIQHKTDVPGPGAYKLPSTIVDLPNYAIPQRSKEFAYV